MSLLCFKFNGRFLVRPVAAMALLALGGFSDQAWAQNPMQAAQINLGAQVAAEKCAVCHGSQGQSVAPDFPRLAGQHASYLFKQLQDFSTGKRLSTVMEGKAKELSAEQIYALGVYYQSLLPVNTAVTDVQLAQVGQFVYDRGNPFTALPACVTCHGTGARGTASLPRLAGQHPDYIVRQVNAFKRRERNNDNAIMHIVADRVNDMELKAVAAYLGGLK